MLQVFTGQEQVAEQHSTNTHELRIELYNNTGNYGELATPMRNKPLPVTDRLSHQLTP